MGIKPTTSRFYSHTLCPCAMTAIKKKKPRKKQFPRTPKKKNLKNPLAVININITYYFCNSHVIPIPICVKAIKNKEKQTQKATTALH